MASDTLGYTVWKREGESAEVTVRGLHLTRENALTFMKLQAEEYCINKVGSDNFVRGQLDNPTLSKNIRDGMVLILDSNTSNFVRITKRVPATFYGYTESHSCLFGVSPVLQERIVVTSSDGQKDIIDCRIDPVEFIHQVKREGTCEKKDYRAMYGSTVCQSTDAVRQSISSSVTANKAKIVTLLRKQKPHTCSLIEQLAEELSVELAKRRAQRTQIEESGDSAKPSISVIPKTSNSFETRVSCDEAIEEKENCSNDKVGFTDKVGISDEIVSTDIDTCSEETVA